MNGCITFGKRFFIGSFCLILLTLCASCSSDTDQDTPPDYSSQSRDCLSCHDATFDSAHRIDCGICHLAVDTPQGSGDNHPAVIAMPAHPDHAARTCGTCHERQTEMVAGNHHYRLNKHIESITTAFSSEPDFVQADARPVSSLSSFENPEAVSELVDDLLARRCLRCHVYHPGDRFDRVYHGTGCAACHLEFYQEKLTAHRFSGHPSEERCLSCHYANHVGYDYVGRYEHDLNEEYRTPYRVGPETLPDYGVEFRQLAPDVHHEAGLICVDCHGQQAVMGTGTRPDCRACHRHDTGQQQYSISTVAGETIFTSAATKKTFRIPQLSHEAHDKYGSRFSCQVCHAQWSFNDGTTHLLRVDHEEFDNFYKLSNDGSYETFRIIWSQVSEDGDLYEPVMTDKFTGEALPGIWFRGFEERRWELMLFAEDADGVIRPARPILDLRVSWIDEDEQIRFDNIAPRTTGPRPYAPHTIGKAGLLYQLRIAPYLDQ